LDVTDDRTSTQDKVIAMRVKLGPQYLNISDAPTPERAKSLADEYMFDDPLAKGRILEMRAYSHELKLSIAENFGEETS